MSQQMKIIGHCRFSWFGISDTGRAISDIEAAKGILWHPHRMAIRFHLFEKVMLPAMQAQTDPDFELVILISEELPQTYRDRLERKVAGTANMRILSTVERDIGRALRPTIRASLEAAERAVHFRIDDDDALANDYIGRLRHLTESGNPDAGTAISFPKGVLSFFHDGVPKHAEYFKSYVAAGLAFVVGESYVRNPFQVQHRQVGKRQPSFVDPTFHAFQVTLHAVNNTRGYDTIVHDIGVTSAGVARVLRNNPALAAGQIVAPDVDEAIGRAFAHSTGSELRAHLAETRDPVALAKAYGFI